MPRGQRALIRRITGALGAAVLSVSLVPGVASAAAKPVAADDGATITAEHWLDRSTFDVTVKSPALHQSVPVRVIVPKGWSKTGRRAWPVLYTYHGGNDTYISWTRSTAIEKQAAGWNAMIVMPDGGENGSYTDWYNYGRGGTPKWETFHTSEVIQLMERNYHAGTSRAVMGISSGAQGAITYAARHPGLFKYAASYSGILHPTSPGIPAVIMFEGLIYGIGKTDPFAIWGVPGRADADANWRAHDPYYLAQNLRGTGLYVSAGTTGNAGPLDPKNMTWDQALKARLVAGTAEQIVGATSTSFVQRLHQLAIPVTTDLYGDGWHQWAYWNVEYHKAWPLIMKAIGAKRV